jgi:hypothetical protein
VAMTTTSKSDAFLFMPLSTERTCQLTFLFDAGKGWQKAFVNNPIKTSKGPFTTYSIKSEDASDNDNNDTDVNIVCFSTSASMSI